MKLKPKHTIAEHFDDIEDIRIERGKKHQLIDIITIAAWCAKPSGNPIRDKLRRECSCQAGLSGWLKEK